ncbi:hypothetical protein K438DRAFT_1981185 [Mycena galopus ATCC 62051]|nr:hypothetical protein K438DRAFT_1981185 [Mycena galopus ATCC 62051]
MQAVSDLLWEKLHRSFPSLIRTDTHQLPPTDLNSKMNFNCVAASFFGAAMIKIEFKRNPTPAKFEAFYNHFGFTRCGEADNGAVIDVWGKDGKPIHVSVLRTVAGHGPLWQSKLGDEEFITHNRMGLKEPEPLTEGAAKYGQYLYSFRYTAPHPLPTPAEMWKLYEEDEEKGEASEWDDKYGVVITYSGH